MNINEAFGANKKNVISMYGAPFVFEVDVGAWHKLTEDETGAAFNKNSIYRDSRGNKQAKLTEHYFVPLLNNYGIPINVKSVDWELWDHVVMGRRIDIKSKRRNTSPRGDYDYHVDASQIKHPCTHYVWSDVFYDSREADIPSYFAFSGWLPKSEFLENARHMSRGEMDGNFKEKKECWKINRFWLRPMDTLINAMVAANG